MNPDPGYQHCSPSSLFLAVYVPMPLLPFSSLPFSFLLAFRARSRASGPRSPVRPSVKPRSTAVRRISHRWTENVHTSLRSITSSERKGRASEKGERARPLWFLIECRWTVKEAFLLPSSFPPSFLMHSLTLWHFIGPIHSGQKAHREDSCQK